jgi:hypothetical protein
MLPRPTIKPLVKHGGVADRFGVNQGRWGVQGWSPYYIIYRFSDSSKTASLPARLAEPFSEGLASVCPEEQSQCAYIDMQGQVRLKRKKLGDAFHDGLVLGLKNESSRPELSGLVVAFAQKHLTCYVIKHMFPAGSNE